MNLSGFFDVQAAPSGWFDSFADANGWFDAWLLSDNVSRQWAIANKNGVPMDNIAFLGVVAIDSVVRVNGILL